MDKLENPELSIEVLKSIERKIESDLAKAIDYEKLDYFLDAQGLPKYIMNQLKEKNIISYDDFIDVSRNATNTMDKQFVNIIKGSALGIISFLKDYILKK